MKYAIQLGKLMKERGVKGMDLVKLTGHTPANISRLRQGKIRAEAEQLKERLGAIMKFRKKSKAIIAITADRKSVV